MIIPTAEFDPFFADDGIPFSQKMLNYIHNEFSDVPADLLNKLAEVQNGVDSQNAISQTAISPKVISPDNADSLEADVAAQPETTRRQVA